MTDDFEQENTPEQLGLTEQDKKDLEQAGVLMFEKLKNDYPNELPDIIVFPDTAARPLFYLTNEVLSVISKQRGVKKPISVLFSVHFPYSRTFVHQLIHENQDLMNFDVYLNSLDLFDLQPESKKRFEDVREINRERAGEIIDEYHRRVGEKDKEPSVIVIDDQIGYTATTAREITIAFGKKVPTYGFISIFDDSHYQKYGIPAKIGLLTERKTFDFRKDKASIGFYREDHYYRKKYPMYMIDDDNDEERRNLKMMFLRDDMRAIGKIIASKLSK